MQTESSLRDKVYNLILEDILSYEYKPNDILNEKVLVKKYNVSKSPVREALLSLCDECVLRAIPRYGYEVIRISTDDIRDMLQFRYVLEKEMLIHNLSNITCRQIDLLERIATECDAEDSDIWEHWKQNSRFHCTLMSMCNNNYALISLQKTMDRLKRAYAQLYWDNIEKASLSLDTRYHKDILKSLKRNFVVVHIRRH